MRTYCTIQNLLNFFFLFICLWLCWVFIAVWAFLLVVASLVMVPGFQSTGSIVVA